MRTFDFKLNTICIPYIFRKFIFRLKYDHDRPLCDTHPLDDTPLCDTPDEQHNVIRRIKENIQIKTGYICDYENSVIAYARLQHSYSYESNYLKNIRQKNCQLQIYVGKYIHS